MKPARVDILLVDDQPAGLVALEAVLEDLGQNLVKAASGHEALRQALAHDFAVILLDVQMPGLDGLETARLIRERDRSRHTPIIFLTAGHRSDAEAIRGYSLEAVDYLVKPVEPEILRSKVKVFVELARQAAEVRRLNADLRNQEERLRRIVETIAEAIVIMDGGGRVTFANASAEKLLGMPREVITQWSHDDPQWKITTVDGRPFPEDELPFTRVMRSDEAVHSTELGVELPGGSRAIVSVNAAPLRDAAGAKIGVVASFSDITRRKEVERLKDELLASVSHELRTPLTSLRGFAELLLKRNFPPEKEREFLGVIHSEAVRLTNLINDFLDLQRIESGRQTYDFQRLDLAPILQQTESLFSGEAGKRTLRLELPQPLPPVWADPDRIRQVLSNLVSNAVKFSPDGSEVTVGARRDGEDLVLWVRDQGIGIRPEDQPKLFQRFFRIDNSETRRIGGTGLGLSLVKQIVEVHKGRVWVESAHGRGSTFWFSLPVAEEAPEPARGEPRSPGQADLLLVEDDQAYALLLREHFEADGLTVAATARGEEALELARKWPPRLALVDIRLAGRTDGWDVVMEMRSDPRLRSVPIFIISASESINLRGLALGGGDYLLKPMPVPLLIQAVRRQLPELSQKRVLVVDDDAEFRRQVRETLRAEGDPEVIEAADGREALERLAEHMPDLLILDLLLPEVDGFEVLHRLRADKRAVNLPVLVVTAKDLSSAEKAYIKMRMATLVGKREASLEHITRAASLVLGAGARERAPAAGSSS